MSARGAVVAVALCVAGCASQPEIRPLALSAPTQLDHAVSDYSGPRAGAVWLRRHVRVKIATAVNPSRVQSVVEVSALVANYSPGEAKTATLVIPAPRGVRLETRSSGPVDVASSPNGAIDPLTMAYTVTAKVPARGRVEFVARYRVGGTLDSDVRWIAAPDAPTAELLLSYHIPSDAVGTFALINAKGRPLVTKKGDLTIIALMMRDVPPGQGASSGYARYATKWARPRGYEQQLASSWEVVLAPYAREFGARSRALRGGAKVPPVKPRSTGVEAVKELALWTRDRLQREDAYAGPWNGGRPLPVIVPRNDLYAVDKVHLLHWLLESAGLPHSVAVVRSKRFPPLTSDLAAPGAFDGVVIFSQLGQLWLDPACRACAPGQVRESLRGQQAVLLAPGKPTLIRLP